MQVINIKIVSPNKEDIKDGELATSSSGIYQTTFDEPWCRFTARR